MAGIMENLELNADFTKRVSVHAAKLDWQSSPMKGVERRMLDRIGDEVARATTIVRYAPGSHFSSHVHTGGEEFIVIEGGFIQDGEAFNKHSWLRLPIESALEVKVGGEGAVVWIKEGHLAHMNRESFATI